MEMHLRLTSRGHICLPIGFRQQSQGLSMMMKLVSFKPPSRYDFPAVSLKGMGTSLMVDQLGRFVSVPRFNGTSKILLCQMVCNAV
jgi:hypothetical protein